MLRPLLGWLVLAGCPTDDLVFADTGCQDSVELGARTFRAQQYARTVWIDARREGAAYGQLALVNRGDAECPVAVYLGDAPVDVEAAPVLIPGEAPPEEVAGLGRVTWAAMLAPSRRDVSFVDLDLELPGSVTIVGCPGLEVSGWIEADCAAEARVE